MNINELKVDPNDPAVSIDKDGKKYEWYEKSPEFLYCKDEDKNEYALHEDTGKLHPIEKGRIWPNYNRTHFCFAQQVVEMTQKRQSTQPM